MSRMRRATPQVQIQARIAELKMRHKDRYDKVPKSFLQGVISGLCMACDALKWPRDDVTCQEALKIKIHYIPDWESDEEESYW